MSPRGIPISEINCNSRYSVLVRLMVTNHVCNVFDVQIIVHLPMPMLVRNLLDFASVLRATRMQNLDDYSKVFIL
jgi:hypothetical protein